MQYLEMDKNIYHMNINYKAVYDAMLKLITKGGSYEKSDLPNHISEYTVLLSIQLADDVPIQRSKVRL